MRDLITTSLDLLGLLLLVAAVTVLVWPHTVPGALAVAGLGLLGTRWLIDRVGRAPEPDAGGDL